MKKSEVYKLLPGTFLEVWWNDASNSVVMLLETPERGAGELSIKCLHQDGHVDSHVAHTQIVKVRGHVKWPAGKVQYTLR